MMIEKKLFLRILLIIVYTFLLLVLSYYGTLLVIQTIIGSFSFPSTTSTTRLVSTISGEEFLPPSRTAEFTPTLWTGVTKPPSGEWEDLTSNMTGNIEAEVVTASWLDAFTSTTQTAWTPEIVFTPTEEDETSVFAAIDYISNTGQPPPSEEYQAIFASTGIEKLGEEADIVWQTGAVFTPTNKSGEIWKNAPLFGPTEESRILFATGVTPENEQVFTAWEVAEGGERPLFTSSFEPQEGTMTVASEYSPIDTWESLSQAIPSFVPQDVTIVAQWNQKMTLNQSKSIKICIYPAGSITTCPSDETFTDFATATPKPPYGATPEAPIAQSFGSDYSGNAKANLAGGAFTIELTGDEEQQLDQPYIDWDWNIVPKSPEDQVINANIEVEWKSIDNNKPIRKREIWQQPLKVYVAPGDTVIDIPGWVRITRDQLGIGALILGLMPLVWSAIGALIVILISRRKDRNEIGDINRELGRLRALA